MSASHKNRGRAWEQVLDAQHEGYALSKRAYVVRCYPEMRAVPGGGIVRAAGGPPDYLLVAAGLTVLFEAKQCAQGRWRFGELQDHQAAQLDAASRQGAHGALLLRFSTASVTCVILWLDIRERWFAWRRGEAARGEASLTVAEAQGVSCWSGRGADYLGPLLRALKGFGPHPSETRGNHALRGEGATP